jgi:MFS transporter, DHA3 family, macrolide efflux protein
MSNQSARPSPAFLRLWLGQVVSVSGSGMTGFALGVHVFQETRSATLFSLITLAATLPGILVAPLAGAVADRWDRRKVIIVSDVCAAVATLVLALLFASGLLALWHIYTMVILVSICSGFQLPAAQAAVTQLVPSGFYAQASGMMQMSRGMQFLVSPLAAGLLLGTLGVWGVLMVDVASFLFGVAMVVSIAIPPLTHHEGGAARGGLWSDVAGGLRYLASHHGMAMLVAIIAIGNFMIGFLVVLVGPMVLAFTTPEVLGVMSSVSALGMLLGSVLVSVKGAPRSLIPRLFLAMVIAGLGLGTMGLIPNATAIAAAAFVFFLTMPVVTACQETLWRGKIALAMQGRMFALTRMIVASASTLAFLVAGPLADRVFAPLLVPGGLLADSVGVVIGVGPGRGIALMLVLSGAIILLVSAIGYLFPSVRNLESDSLDVTAEPHPGSELDTSLRTA